MNNNFSITQTQNDAVFKFQSQSQIVTCVDNINAGLMTPIQRFQLNSSLKKNNNLNDLDDLQLSLNNLTQSNNS
jgi:hypothetical protein